MNFNLENKGSDRTIPIEIQDDKVNIFIYGKNGSGKTTFSRMPEFKDYFVFNEDFINKNIFVIQHDGAYVDQSNQTEFTKLWIGEEEVKLKNEIMELKNKYEFFKEDFEEKKQKIISNILAKKLYIDSNFISNALAKIEDKKFIYTVKDVEKPEFINYKFDAKLETFIENDQDFEQKLKSYEERSLSNQLLKFINSSVLLKELLFNDSMIKENIRLAIENYNKSIDDNKQIDNIIANIENITTKGKVDIWAWIKKGLEFYDKEIYNKCLFCGSTNIDIEETLEKLKIMSKCEAEKRKDELNEKLENLKKDVDKILERKEDYISFAPKVINSCEKLKQEINSILNNIKNSEKVLSDFSNYEIETLFRDANQLQINLLNYLLNKHLYELLKFDKMLVNTKNMIATQEKKLSDLLIKNSEKNEEVINSFLSKLDVNKKIKLKLNRRGSEKTYELTINGNKIKELSSGEKHKLALAIFFSLIVNQKTLKDKIIVIDDPVTSTDTDSYHCFKNVIIELKDYFDETTKLFILTHNIDYLYVQISNIFSNETFRNETVIYKLTPDKIQPVDIEVLGYDDLVLFKKGLEKFKTPNEFLVLGGLIPKIFRYIIDIQLRFQGFSGIISAKQGEDCVKKEIEKLSLSQTIKEELQISRKIINKLFESNNFKVKDVISGIVELKKVTGLLGIKEYISNAILTELNNKFSIEELNKCYSTDLQINDFIFDIIYNATKILDKKRGNTLKGKREYLAHPRNQITKNIVATAMDEPINTNIKTSNF